MQIPLKWINELVNIETVELDDLIEKLTLGGFEVEEILEIEIDNQKQIALDISATANRSDSLSIQGISTEISALLNKPLKTSTYSLKSENLKNNILENAQIIPLETECSILLSIVVDNVSDPTVPKWLKQKLISSGLTPVNNLIDFQNYILLETGYPFAFYDFAKITSKLNTPNFDLEISHAKIDQEFIGNNNQHYKLDESILTIKANEIAISIAGIIENQEFSYCKNTNSLLIEASIFSAAKIRQQSRKLGLRTDRSTRYEKSLKNTYLIEALYRLISLLRISNPNLKCKFHTISKKIDTILKPILLRYERICEILGPTSISSSKKLEYVTITNIENYLNRLNFKFVYDNLNQVWEVTIPDSRTDDITREIDLIEEIGRLHGFNNFLITLPKLKTIGKEDATYKTRQKITSCLLNLGFNELIHYSLVTEKTFIDNEIKLINPLVSEYSNLRISLLPSLIKTIQENLRQGNYVMNGFEYGHIFGTDPKIKFQEKETIAGIFGGFKTKLTWSDPETGISWFEAKGKMDQFFKQLNISVSWKNVFDSPINYLFHTYRNAEIYLIDNKKLGIFGQIHPRLANKLNISPELYLFEFSLEALQNQIQLNQLTVYKEYSSYPKIIKDISFIVRQDVTFKELQETLFFNGTKFLSEINLLDEYTGNSIPEKHISLCLQLIFQSNEKTLQNKEIEEILDNIRDLLTKRFNAVIRN